MTVKTEYGCQLQREELATTTQFICGTEYEIESIKACTLDGFMSGEKYSDEVPYWMGDIGVMRDGSLRNGGLEFVTRPVTEERALELFTTLHDNLSLGKDPFSARTSTHVHVNVASMTLEQVRHLTMLYALLEPVFFVHAQGREHNIHCVPLSYTLLPQYYSAGISALIDRWSKYTAFNLLPIVNIGTVEFRHLGGTGDIKVYQRWLRLLRELWTFAMHEPVDALYSMLKRGDNPMQIQNVVLPSANDIVIPSEAYKTTLIDVKLGFV